MSDSGAVAADWSAWIGRSETLHDAITQAKVADLAATLDEGPAPGGGEPLPPGWHWIFFNTMAARRDLGADGHPRRGGFLPPLSLPRRMWAGGRIDYRAPLHVGASATRTSVLTAIESKAGRSGSLVFVTVTHTIASQGRDCIVEEQDIVFREAAPDAAAQIVTPLRTIQPEPEATWREVFSPDPTLLFRYSALTSNGHRIHYDQTYARDVEGYRDLVVHGPLTATLLQALAARAAPERRLTRFTFRGAAPLLVHAPFTLNAIAETPPRLRLWASDPSGAAAMHAAADFAI